MRHASGAALLLLVGLALGCASAPPPGAGFTPEEQRIQALLEAVELPRFAEKLEEVALRVAGTPRDEKLPEDQRLRPRIEAQLAPDAVVADVVRRVAKSFDASFVAELERFDASPLGRKLRDAADAPYSWFSRLGYRLFGGFTDDAPARVALIDELNQLTRSNQTTTETYMAVFAAIVRWYDTKGFISPDEADAVGGTDTLVVREREKVEALTAQHSVPFGLWAFSDLSTEELSAYVAHVRSPAGQWFATTVRAALIESIEERAAAIGG
jgi:alkylhydroperoxidase family enzyme